MTAGSPRFPENAGVRTITCQKRRLAILRFFNTAKFYYKSINVRGYSILITGFDISMNYIFPILYAIKNVIFAEVIKQ